MAINNIATGVRNTMCDAFVDALDAGAGAGVLQSWTAAFATQLATNTFTDPAFGASAAGVATAAAIADDVSADATGTAAVLRMRDSTPATVAEGTIGAGSGDLNMNTVSWTAGDRIHVNDFATITMPAS
jgi:hypothetical protein